MGRLDLKRIRREVEELGRSAAAARLGAVRIVFSTLHEPEAALDARLKAEDSAALKRAGLTTWPAGVDPVTTIVIQKCCPDRQCEVCGRGEGVTDPPAGGPR